MDPTAHTVALSFNMHNWMEKEILMDPESQTNFLNVYLDRALPCASKSTVGICSLTKRVNKLCSMLLYFLNAMFLMTGGSWWWSPIMIHRFKRLWLSTGFCK